MIYTINMHATVYQFWRFVYHHEQFVIGHYARISLYTLSFCTEIWEGTRLPLEVNGYFDGSVASLWSLLSVFWSVRPFGSNNLLKVREVKFSIGLKFWRFRIWCFCLGPDWIFKSGSGTGISIRIPDPDPDPRQQLQSWCIYYIHTYMYTLSIFCFHQHNIFKSSCLLTAQNRTDSHSLSLSLSLLLSL